MATAVYPGSFDPVTKGHLDIIKRAAKINDHLIVAVLINSAKDPLFTVEERVALLTECCKGIPNVSVESFDGLTVEFAKKRHASVMVRGLRAVVLSRGYKAQPPELPLHVSPSRTPGEAGDEPLMLALEHPSAAVMVDPDRRRSGRWAEERLSPDLFVLDDGFQHVKVRRDLDIVLLRPDDLGDGWGRVIPAGAWREGPEALERADVFMIKCSPEAWESLRPACERRLAGFRRPLFSFSLRPSSLREIGTDECRDAEAFAGKPYALATGVGDPAQVRETVARFMGREPAEFIAYPDHHAYTPEDTAKLEGLGMPVICTSKDAVKLRELRLADAWALRVEAAFGPALWTEAAFPHWLDAWAKRKGLF